MAKRRHKVGRKIRHGARRAAAAMGSKPGQVVMMAAEATLGGVLTSMAIGKFAPTTMTPTMKAGIQAGLGIAAVAFVRNKHVKSLGAGAVIAAMMSVAQNVFKVSPLAGPTTSRTLSPSELQRLVSGGMGLPLNLPLSSGVPSGAGFKGGFGNS